MGIHLHAVEYREIPLSLQLLSFSTLSSTPERDTLPEMCRIPITHTPSLYPAHESLCNSLLASPNGSTPTNISSRCYQVKWTPVRRILLCLRKQIQACEAICSCRVAILIFLCTMCNKERYQTSLSSSQQPWGRKQEGEAAHPMCHIWWGERETEKIYTKGWIEW